MSLPATLRRWFQFSLAELVVGTILLGAGVGIYVTPSSSTYQHDLKLADIRVARLIAPDMMLVLSSNKNEDELFKVNIRSGGLFCFYMNPAPQNNERIVSFDISRDRKKLVVRKGAKFFVCDLGGGKITSSFNTGYCSSFALSAHGDFISAHVGDTPSIPHGPVFNAETGGVVPEWERMNYGVRAFVVGDSRVLCIDPPNVAICEFSSGKELVKINCGQLPNSVLAVSDDESCFGIEDSPGTVKLFDSKSGNPIGEALRYGNEPLTDIAFEPVGKMVALSTFNGKITIWNRDTGKLTATIDTGAINQYIAFPERGRLLTLSADGKLTVRRVGANNSEIALYIVAACALAVLVLLRLFRRVPAKKTAS